MSTYTLITGGNSGIGLKTAEALARQKRNIILVARDEKKSEVAAAAIRKETGVDVRTYSVDVCDDAAVERFFAEIKGIDIDVLINNAGLALGKDSFQNYDFEDCRTMVETNVIGFLKIAHMALPHLKKTKGHIVNISSIAGIEAYEGGSIYCATKAFVKMISRSLRIDLAGTGIRVTDIAPGAVETNFSNVRFKGDSERAASVYKGFAPLKPDDIADCIAFAVSRPAHVNIDSMLVMPTAQASAARFVKT